MRDPSGSERIPASCRDGFPSGFLRFVPRAAPRSAVIGGFRFSLVSVRELGESCSARPTPGDNGMRFPRGAPGWALPAAARSWAKLGAAFQGCRAGAGSRGCVRAAVSLPGVMSPMSRDRLGRAGLLLLELWLPRVVSHVRAELSRAELNLRASRNRARLLHAQLSSPLQGKCPCSRESVPAHGTGWNWRIFRSFPSQTIQGVCSSLIWLCSRSSFPRRV